MNNKSTAHHLFNMGKANLGSVIAAEVYKRLPIDFTRPSHVYAELTHACNSKCRMCDVWRDEVLEEIPAAHWIKAIKQIKKYIPGIKVSFAGGEVLMKDDFFDICEFCNKEQIPYGITTNGNLLTADIIRKLLNLSIFNINISLDSLDSQTYKKLRGADFFQTVIENIEYLQSYLARHSFPTKVFIKTVASSYNIEELPDIARYAKKLNTNGITFDPVKKRREPFLSNSDSAFNKMQQVDIRLLKTTVDELMQMKSDGYNILNSEENMRQWFKPRQTSDLYFCKSPLRDVFIDRKGDVRLCDFTDSTIGNITSDGLVEMLKSKNTKITKKVLTNCPNPCVYCTDRSLMDYSRILINYLR